MKKILIIGSQGYLGSRLVDYLFECGYECAGSDLGYFQYGVLYNPKVIRNLGKSAEHITPNDIKNYHVVIQLAGISNDPFGELNPKKIYDPTRKYALKIAEACKKMGVRYIFPSSCSVYGIGGTILDEDGPVNPQTPYSLNKVQIEEGLGEIADKNFSPIALRLATVFGCSPRIRFDVVINMLCGMAVAEKKLLLNSNGEAWRPHLHIEDVCEAFKCCIEWDYNGGKLLKLNVGRNDNNWKIIDIARYIQSEIKDCKLECLKQKGNKTEYELIKDRKIQDGVDKRTYQVNFDRIHRKLPNFQAKWDVKSGIKQLLSELKKWKLDNVKYKQREFYRLQQIEHLLNTHQISF